MGDSAAGQTVCADNRRMSIQALHHVQLAMPPGKESEAEGFYAGLLGMPRVDKPPHLEERGGCWFESDETRIHLGVEEDFRPARKAHPALLVDDLGELRRSLEQAGVRVVDDQPLPGFNRFYADDPFGNRLEFLSPDETEPGKVNGGYVNRPIRA
jgi:catechol 2,3-dioxygenase-like lactoylglutathione lyase family enzyme